MASEAKEDASTQEPATPRSGQHRKSKGDNGRKKSSKKTSATLSHESSSSSMEHTSSSTAPAASASPSTPRHQPAPSVAVVAASSSSSSSSPAASSSSSSPSAAAAAASSSSSAAPADHHSHQSHAGAPSSDILARLYASPPTHDMAFHFGKEILPAHSFVIHSRCPPFFQRAQSFIKLREKGKGREKRVDAIVALDEEVSTGAHSGVSLTTSEVFSHAVLRKLFEFLYIDNLQLADVSPETVLHLLICGAFFGLDRVVWLCEAQLQQAVAHGNILALLKISDRYKQENIKALCLDWVFANYDPFLAIVMSLSEAQLKQELGLPLFLHVVYQHRQFEVFHKAHPAPVDDSPYPLFRHTLPAEPPSTLAADLEKLLTTPVSPDVHVRFEHSPNSRVAFHAALVGLASADLFRFASANAVAEDFSALFKQRSYWKITAEASLSVLRFLYLGCTDIAPLHACRIASFAAHWNWEPLHAAIKNVITNAITIELVLHILCITYDPLLDNLPFYTELRARCLEFCSVHFFQLDLGLLRTQPPLLSTDILIALQGKCLPGSMAFPHV